jgi:hypothetical protein
LTSSARPPLLFFLGNYSFNPFFGKIYYYFEVLTFLS